MGRPRAVLADSGPVLVLALIAAAGSFTHIRDTADQHGQHGPMAWAVAVCIDLTCVMAARERQRDRRTGRRSEALVSWPAAVLVGGILLSLAANLAQAERSAWGWVVAATPASAFLVAVSMLERRNAGSRRAPATDALTVPPSFGNPDALPDAPAAPAAAPVRPQITAPARPEPAPADEPASPPAPLVAFARRVADEHHARHGCPIPADALRARLGVSDQLARDLLGHLTAA
ncbi:DUF2637 domain-containing protein [Actinomadura logoneensis]|uniref:DUF2637 domain-containing protein n=1 Tax=Actinomadura logoneensis TaxID=2293572 RepID=A0A372JS52_9ACTN|nr:DUF2637 domain-containing protein [Actinomadura logoneensis]RFU42780.1 DUF2637 domain-containing protein [Actinomadura logoneensis]